MNTTKFLKLSLISGLLLSSSLHSKNNSNGYISNTRNGNEPIAAESSILIFGDHCIFNAENISDIVSQEWRLEVLRDDDEPFLYASSDKESFEINIEDLPGEWSDNKWSKEGLFPLTFENPFLNKELFIKAVVHFRYTNSSSESTTVTTPLFLNLRPGIPEVTVLKFEKKYDDVYDISLSISADRTDHYSLNVWIPPTEDFEGAGAILLLYQKQEATIECSVDQEIVISVFNKYGRTFSLPIYTNDLIASLPTSLSEISVNDRNVYPTSANAFITVSIPFDEKNTSYHAAITDLQGHSYGQYPLASEETVIDISDIRSGNYLVHIMQNGMRIKTTKIVKTNF